MPAPTHDTHRTCVVLRTHFIDDDIFSNLYAPLQASLPVNYHLVVAFDRTWEACPNAKYPLADLLYVDEATMRQCNALHRDSLYNFDSFLAHVFRERSGFEDYWILEYDVRYSGDWGKFFLEQERHTAVDALLVHGTWPFNGDTDWWVWHELQWGEEKSLKERYAGFIFLGRYSRNLMACVNELLGRRSGHAEVYLATLCSSFGFPTAAIDPLYHGSICTTNDEIDAREYDNRRRAEPNKLFHKIKPNPVVHP